MTCSTPSRHSKTFYTTSFFLITRVLAARQRQRHPPVLTSPRGSAGESRPVRVITLTIWAGRVLSALAILFLAFDTVIKVLNLPPAVEATTQLGYPAGLVVTIGLIELACLVLYAIPRTAIIGALLLTGYLGGAIATQVRAGAPLFPVVFPLIIGALVWGGLVARNARLRALLSPQV